MAEKTNDLTKADFDAIAAGRTEMDRSPAAATTRVDTGNDETEHLKAQIEETRREMGETIDAIQDRLSFSNISEQVSEHVSTALGSVKQKAYNATIGKAVGAMKTMGHGISDSKFVRTARNNPFPLILIGLGAGLLTYNSFAGQRRRRAGSLADRSVRPDLADARNADFTNANDPADTSQTSVNPQQGNQGLTSRVTSVATSAYDSVSHAMDSAYSGARDFADRAYSKAGEYGNYAYETYDHYLEANPLAVGAVAFAVGAAVGLAIPSTRYEGALMGETRDQLLRKAQDKGSMLLDKTRHFVDEATSKLSSEEQPIIH
jgi:ElaB/YqjD/DUF883 family membrane-anchored ribosome-binding protein